MAAQNALIDLGPYIFLNEASTCDVYQARPDACRACHVWHTAEHCGREDYDMCTPAEFNALRVDRIHQLMLEELNLGRRLFRLRTLFRSEEKPMGFPRAAAAPDRDFLEAFPLD